MHKINLSKTEECTLKKVIPNSLVMKMEKPDLVGIIEITKELERILPKKITQKLNELKLDEELIDLIEINAKITGVNK